MGIPYYFAHLIKNNPAIIQKWAKTIPVLNFFLDSNSIIYDTVHKNPAITDEATIIQKVITKIEEYITVVRPQNLTYVAFDGVAPMAKMVQQRGRRFKSAFIASANPTTEPTFDTVQITPGTPFMATLSATITAHFQSNPSIIVSGSNEVGEAEHKIFHYLRGSPSSSHQNNFIYGLDADLCMLSLHHNNIYLIREVQHFGGSAADASNPDDLYIVNINKLRKNIWEKEGVPAEDYIFLCFLLGNDFLPHFLSLNIRTTGIQRLLEAYHAISPKTLIHRNTGKVIWKNFGALVAYLARNETRYMEEEYELRNKRGTPRGPPTLDQLPLYEREMEHYLFGAAAATTFRIKYYSLLVGCGTEPVAIKKVCMEYLANLEWTFYYYKEDCVDWTTHYSHSYPPLFADLLKYIPQAPNSTFIKRVPPAPVDPLVQLIYVLPHSATHILPKGIQAKLRPEWYSKYPDFTWVFTKYLWEAHVELPHMDIADIAALTKTTP